LLANFGELIFDKDKDKTSIEFFKEARTNMWYLLKEYGLDISTAFINSNLGSEVLVNPKKEKITEAIL
jgi:hypothetical protein